MRDRAITDGTALVEAIKSSELSARAVCEDLIKKISHCEPKIHAFAQFDEGAVLRQADAIDQDPCKGRLAGLPVGIKDIFDTADFRTEYNSPIYRGHRPSRDCAIVARLRAAGAVLVGKTETTEFAFMHTGPTRNPHGLDRTPGSSSAGSAAGMAAGFFPVALGTQTAGSLIKPASYCGSFAFKPSYGLVSLEGVKPLAPSLDTVGWFGRSAEDLELISKILLGTDMERVKMSQRSLRLVVSQTDFWDDAEDCAKNALSAATEVLRARGHAVDRTTIPFDFRKVAAAHRVINDREGSRSLAFECEYHKDLVSPSVVQMMESAHKLSFSDEIQAKTFVSSTAEQMDRFMIECDAIVTLSTAGEAPVGLEKTGTSDFIKTWHALGMPQANVPIALGRNRMPIGLQLVGRRGGDRHLLDVVGIVSAELGVRSSAVLDV